MKVKLPAQHWNAMHWRIKWVGLGISRNLAHVELRLLIFQVRLMKIELTEVEYEIHNPYGVEWRDLMASVLDDDREHMN